MRLNREQSEAFLAFLKEQWTTGIICPVCMSKSWNVSDTVFELREFQGGAMVLGGGLIQPIIPVSCTKCGYVIHFNAVHAGVVKAPQKDGAL
jgi:hypothetical protein